MIIFGNRLFGKVDQVPGLGHVATKFFHIDYVPLIPHETWLVFKQDGRSWRGIKIPFSAKSLLVAWSRAGSLVVGVIGVVLLIIAVTDPRSKAADIAPGAVLTALGCGVFAACLLHKGITRASYARACQLARLAKFSDQAMVALAAKYGQPPPTFGFQPVQSPASAPLVVETIPMEEPEVEQDLTNLEEDPHMPIKPMGETRRHG